MKLHYANASPFVRKVLVVAHETQQFDKIELLPAATTPVKPNPQVSSDNPLAKIPTLILDDGSSLYDSRVIAEYLSETVGSPLFPTPGPARWTALRRLAAADGLLDAAILIRYERAFRPPELQFAPWIDGQYTKIRQTLAAFDQEADGFAATPTIGEIAIACALGYLDFRFGEEHWRDRHPALAHFYASVAERPSMLATQPEG